MNQIPATVEDVFMERVERARRMTGGLAIEARELTRRFGAFVAVAVPLHEEA